MRESRRLRGDRVYQKSTAARHCDAGVSGARSASPIISNQNNTRRNVFFATASCAAVGIDLASEVARHADQPARRLDRFLWWGDAPVYDMYDVGDFLDRLDWNQVR